MAVIASLFDKNRLNLPIATAEPSSIKTNSTRVIPDLFKETKTVMPQFAGQPKSSLFQEAIIKPVKTFGGGIQKAASNLADTLGFYSDKISEKTGLPKTKVFDYLKDTWATSGEQLQKEGVSNKFIKSLYSGLGQAAFDVPVKYMGPGKFLKGATLPIVSATEGFKEGGIKGAITGGVSGALMKGTLTGMETLPTKIKLPTAFGVGATVTPGGLEEKVAGGAVFTGLSMGSKAPTMREFKATQGRYSPVVKVVKNLFPAQKMEGIYQSFVNHMQSIENVVEKAKNLGAKILPGENPALRARTYLGIGQKVKTILENKTYRITPEGKYEITGEGLKPILDNYDKVSPEKNRTIRDKDLNDYLIAQRTIKDLQRPKSEFNQENIVTPEQVKTAQNTLDKLGKKYRVPQPTEGKVLYHGTNISKETIAKEGFRITELNRDEGLHFTLNKEHANKFGVNVIETKFSGKIGDKVYSSPDKIPSANTIKKQGLDAVRYMDNGVESIYVVSPSKLSTPTGEGQKPTTIPHLEQTATRLYDYQKRVLSILVDSGNISQEQYNTILAKNPNYVPFDRVIEGVDTAGTPVSKNRFSGARSPIKRIKGSELEIHNPIESMIKNTYRIMDIAERNTVARGVAKLGEVLPKEISPVEVKMVPVATVEHKAGIDMGFQKEQETIFRPSQFKPKGNVIEYFDGGKRKYMEVTPNLYSAMTGLNETSTSLLTKIMSVPAQTLRTGATITPEFMLRNPIRDQWTAFMQTKLGFKPFVDNAGAIADIMGKSEAYNDWLRSGGAYSGFVETSRGNMKKILKNLQGKPDLMKSLNIISKAQDISQLFEQATRLSVYKAGVKKGLTPVEAGFESREATVDFARRGAKTKDINSVIAFFNAGIQGSDKLVRTAKEDPVGFAAKGIASITIPSLITYALNRNDPGYKELPRWQKDLFWILKVKDTYVRIPKPFAYGQIFGSLPERFMEYLDTQDPKAFNDLEKSLYDSLLPTSGDPVGGMMATGVKPLIENASNWSFFGQRAIVPESKQGLLPEKQYGRYTTETAKKIGEIINYSPSKIENLVRGWFGGSGQYVLQASDLLGKGIAKFTGQPVIQQGPAGLADIPLIKGFIARSPEEGQSESINQFYRDREKITQAYSTIQKYYKEGNKTKANELKLKYPNYKLYKAVNKTAKMLSDLSSYGDNVIKSSKSDKEKKELLRKMNQRRMEITQQANKFIK